MNLNIHDLRLPENLRFKQEWQVLEDLLFLNPIKGFTFKTNFESLIPRWDVVEVCNPFVFQLYREKHTKQRITENDPLGCVGFASINPLDDRVYLTEGVSDFITVKLTHPHFNVLGMTTLGGNQKAKSIVLNLFKKIVICSDNDSTAEINTGLSNALKMKKFYQAWGKQVKILLPEAGYGKDMTDQFMGQLREYYASKFV